MEVPDHLPVKTSDRNQVWIPVMIVAAANV
jgi:hypothetical protein